MNVVAPATFKASAGGMGDQLVGNHARGDSLLDGTVTGVTSCLHNYDAALAAVTC